MIKRLPYSIRVTEQIIAAHGPHLSYDAIAALGRIDRSTARQAVILLERSGRVQKVRGAGRHPNSYYLL